MPIYEYRCQKCGQKFEQRVGFFHSPKSTKCPKCASDETERVFSPVASNTGSCGGGSGRYQ